MEQIIETPQAPALTDEQLAALLAQHPDGIPVTEDAGEETEAEKVLN